MIHAMKVPGDMHHKYQTHTGHLFPGFVTRELWGAAHLLVLKDFLFYS